MNNSSTPLSKIASRLAALWAPLAMLVRVFGRWLHPDLARLHRFHTEFVGILEHLANGTFASAPLPADRTAQAPARVPTPGRTSRSVTEPAQPATPRPRPTAHIATSAIAEPTFAQPYARRPSPSPFNRAQPAPDVVHVTAPNTTPAARPAPRTSAVILPFRR